MPSKVSVAQDTWEYVAEFYHNSFSKSVNGDFKFTVSFEGKDCSGTSPTVKNVTTLLKLNASPVSANACGPDSTCWKTDGAALGKCYAKSKIVSIKGQKWGEYKLTISGTVTGSDVCWTKVFDIMIGAGASNPVKHLDVPRTSSTGNCS